MGKGIRSFRSGLSGTEEGDKKEETTEEKS
jgi:Sec-independent protein translocase protein TatA